MSQGIIFAAGTKAQNIASAWAFDGLVLAAAFAANMADPADTTAYGEPVPHPDAEDARVLYEVDDFTTPHALAQGFTLVDVERPGPFFPPPAPPSAAPGQPTAGPAVDS